MCMQLKKQKKEKRKNAFQDVLKCTDTQVSVSTDLVSVLKNKINLYLFKISS